MKVWLGCQLLSDISRPMDPLWIPQTVLQMSEMLIYGNGKLQKIQILTIKFETREKPVSASINFNEKFVLILASRF